MENTGSTAGRGFGAPGTGFKIEDHDQYLEVVIDGVLLKHTILSSIGELLKQPGFQRIPLLWNLARAKIHLSMADLRDIVDVLGKMPAAPAACLKNPVSVVVSGNFNFSIASVFVEAAAALPYQWKIFSDEPQARKYLQP